MPMFRTTGPRQLHHCSDLGPRFLARSCWLVLLVFGFALPAASPAVVPTAVPTVVPAVAPAVAPAAVSATVSPSTDGQLESSPRNVILFISDGCGPASFTMARNALGRPLALDGLRVGSCSTQASDTWVTDSAASATALATGHKTQNGVVGLDEHGQPVATLLEAAEERGLATGLVTTTAITHATPACFASHVPSRAQAGEIAVQLLAHDIEVLFGGGSQYFLPPRLGGIRDDTRDLISEATDLGVTVVRDGEALQGPVELPVLGLFAPNHLDYEIDRQRQPGPAQPDVTQASPARPDLTQPSPSQPSPSQPSPSQPSLEAMTERALQLLSATDQGFFLMVEGGRIDHAGHENDAVAHLRDLEAFDAAVRRGLAFAAEHGDTLIVSTSDHETGGLTLAGHSDGVATYAWQPDVLSAGRSSAGAMAERLLQGDDPGLVFTQDARMDDLTDAELALLSDHGGGLFAMASRASTVAAVCRVINERAGLSWSTLGHTGVDVPVFAVGPGSQRFTGQQDNTALGQRLADLLGFDLAELTTRLRAGDTPWLP